MPFVNVRIAGTLTRDQKAAVAHGITDVLERVAGKPARETYVVIEEVALENWAVGGELVSVIRSRQ